MLKYLARDEKNKTRNLYEQAFFEDSSNFIDYYYKEKNKNNKILVYEKDGQIASMAHLNPYKMKFSSSVYEIDYIVAVATDIKFRRMGLMRELISRFLRDMYTENKPFTFLLPANKAYYEPFDFIFVNKYEKIEFNELGKSLEKVYYEDKYKEELIKFINETLDKDYDAYCIRDEENFSVYLKELRSENGYIELFLDKDKIVAYKSFWGIKKLELRDFIANPRYINKEITDKEAYMLRIVSLKDMIKELHLNKKSNTKKISLTLNIEDKIIPENNGNFNLHINIKETLLEKLDDNFNPDLPIYTVKQMTEYLLGLKTIKDFENLDIDKPKKKKFFMNEVV